MTSIVAYPHIAKPADGPAHLERVPRVRVALIVMDYLAHGWSPEEMCRHYPYLTLSEAHAAMLYYWDHQEEIDAEISEELSEAEADGRLPAHHSLARKIGIGKQT